MKQVLVKTMMLVAMAATAISFTTSGGEGFEISLNNKVVIQQFGKPNTTPETLRLNQYSANDQLTVKYYHCGQAGKNRVLTIKDRQDKVLKQWRFADGSSAVAPMNCNVKDILNLKKGNESAFKLYYASSQLPNERLLTTIVVENNIVARNN